MKSFVKYILLLSIIAAAFSSCKKKDEKLGGGTLNFSHDTLFFDTTVFTEIKTITRRVTVYNYNSNAVEIEEISVPEGSDFKLIINGRRTNNLKNHVLRGNDKLLILLEATLEKNNIAGGDSILLVEEKIKFITNGAEQNVVLVAPSLDVYFHKDEVTGCDEVWRNDLPHVIYNSVLVPTGCKLTIEEGSAIFNHGRSGIFVEGNIEAIGTPEKRIIFTDDRLETDYNDIFGIWEGIFLLPNSTNNKLKWIVLENAVNGIRVNYFNRYKYDDDGNVIEEPDFFVNMSGGSLELELSHSIIKSIGSNSNAPSFTGGLSYSGIGLIGRNCDITVHNSLITNCTVGSAMFLLNGEYKAYNNTFANYPVNGYNRSKDVRSFYASSILLNSDGSIDQGGNMELQFINNIVYGENNDPEEENNLDEIILSMTDEFKIEITGFINNIIKTEELKDALSGGENILNDSPFENSQFMDDHYNYNLEATSNAVDAGYSDLSVNTGITDIDIDLNGNVRTGDWDIGAFEVE